MEKITIYGAGVQGSMLAYRCAVYGKNVALFDIEETVLVKAKEKITGWLEKYSAAGRYTKDEARSFAAAIGYHKDVAVALADADLVIECVPEKLELKQQVWNEIDRIAPDKTYLTTNSSSLRSSEIGKDVARKEKTFNVNFMTPTEDDLVEVMWNPYTAEDTKTFALDFLYSIACVPTVTAKEIKGFSLNRVWRAVKKECLKLWAEGYIAPEDLDRAFMLEWATEDGPFGRMDKVGLDVIHDIEMSYYRESGDPSDLPPKALEDMVSQGKLGEKSGIGFYTYPNPSYLAKDFLKGKK